MKKAWPWLALVLSIMVMALLGNWQHVVSVWLQLAAGVTGFWALMTGRLKKKARL